MQQKHSGGIQKRVIYAVAYSRNTATMTFSRRKINGRRVGQAIELCCLLDTLKDVLLRCIFGLEVYVCVCERASGGNATR